MSIVLYSKYRRMKLRAAWELAGMAVWLKEVGVYLVGFLIIVFMLQMWDARAEAVEQAELEASKAARLEAAWVSCMNRGGIWVNDELFTCHVENTRFTKGNFK